jgi:hypothetical protein
MDNQTPTLAPEQCQARVFHIPDTLTNWPWPRRMNPRYGKVKANLDEWIKRFPLDSNAINILENAETGGLPRLVLHMSGKSFFFF